MTRKTRRSKAGQSDPPRRSSAGVEEPRQAPAEKGGKGPAKKRAGKRSASAGKAAAPKSKARKSTRATGVDEASGPESPPADSQPSASPKKVSLPAFGFAEDLLGKSAGDDEPAAGDGTTPSDEATPTDPATEEESSAAPPASIDEADPRRIFAFADSLDRRGVEAEAPAAPVRLETWVAFSLAGEVFALPVAPIQEVVRVASITRVPHAPKPIRGVTNRRGRVIPVIDLRMRIDLPAAELSRASRIIVVSSRGRLLGLLVDAVHQVVHIDLERVQPPPDDVMTVQSDYLSGVYHLDDQLILLLDIDRALIVQQAPAAGARSAPATGPGTAVEPSPGPA